MWVQKPSKCHGSSIPGEWSCSGNRAPAKWCWGILCLVLGQWVPPVSLESAPQPLPMHSVEWG